MNKMQRQIGMMTMVLALILLLASCSEPLATGAVELVFSDSTEKSIIPETTKITWIQITGSRNDDSSITIGEQSFKLGGSISITGLSVGVWTFRVTGYTGDPDATGSVLLTQVAVDDDVVIQSGKTTTALFALRYLTEGDGSATVVTTWPSAIPVILTGSLSDGTTTISPSASSTSGAGTATIEFGSLEVGDYDLALVATNLSGKTIGFPMIDMVNIFSDLTSTGSIALEAADLVSAPIPSLTAGETFTSVTETPYAYRLVTLTSGTSGAEFYYTTDGTSPGFTTAGVRNDSTSKYTVPFEITASSEAKDTTVKAIAVCNGYVDSSVSSQVFTVNGLGNGGVEITDPSLISQVDITQDGTNPLRFNVSYISSGTPNEVITWYVDTKDQVAGDVDGDNDQKTITFASLSPGRHQIMVNIAYTDGEDAKTAYKSLRCTIE